MTEIILSDGSKLNYFDKKISLFLNKMTMLYGATDSGKTTILLDIMYLLKDVMAHVFVICPTNFTAGIYDSILPSHCIIPGTNNYETSDFLNNFLNRQANITNIYNDVNNVDNLQKLFSRLTHTDAMNRASFIISSAEKMIKDIEYNDNYNIVEKKKHINNINEQKNSSLISIYKSSINKYRAHFESMLLSDNEKKILRFINLCPYSLLVLDDMASSFKQVVKIDPSIIKKLFFQSRQSNITTIVLTQSDKEFASEYRINVKSSIFTTDQAAMINFNRPSNGFTPEIKKKAAMCIKVVFETDKKKSETKNYKKLAFIHSTGEFCVFQADLHNEFKMGSEAIWKYSVELKHKEKYKNTKQNTLVKKYL